MLVDSREKVLSVDSSTVDSPNIMSHIYTVKQGSCLATFSVVMYSSPFSCLRYLGHHFVLRFSRIPLRSTLGQDRERRHSEMKYKYNTH